MIPSGARMARRRKDKPEDERRLFLPIGRIWESKPERSPSFAKSERGGRRKRKGFRNFSSKYEMRGEEPMERLLEFLNGYWAELLYKTWEHLYISGASVIMGVFVAVPLGVILTRFQKLAGWVIGIASVLQTLPSLAILAFFIPVLGVGKIPAIVALFFYSVLPILRNTYIGINHVNRDLKEAGIGMGMTGWERIRHVELPLSMPVIMAGIRVSAVYLIGWATLASFIGAGGLGDFIFSGLNLYQPESIIAGAVPVAFLALLADYVLGKLEKWATPEGLEKSGETARGGS